MTKADTKVEAARRGASGEPTQEQGSAARACGYGSIHSRLEEISSAMAETLPLPVKRFAQEVGCESAVAAMEARVEELLSKYSRRWGDHVPLSVRYLCEICQVSLVGAPGRFKRRSDLLSTEEGRHGRRHSARINFDRERSIIRVSPWVDPRTARVAVAHELGHWLIHKREGGVDYGTVRLRSSAEEEELAEYGARLLLMPRPHWKQSRKSINLAGACLREAKRSETTIHSAASRLGDPDQPNFGIRAIILWRSRAAEQPDQTIAERVRPYWKVTSKKFIPVHRCGVREGSLIEELAMAADFAEGMAVENVRIGELQGVYRVEAISWGSLRRDTRVVLSVFREGSGE